MNEESTKSFQDALFTALNLFNNHEWYEAHDAFEEIWNSVDGDERQVIQGILQVSVSQFHLSKGNFCLLYTSPSPRDSCASRMPSSA